MFTRRLYILLGAFLLAGAVVLARLAQVQIGWHERFELAAYSRAGGDHIVDTVRGGIYTRWGTPLARQVATFGLGVLYDRLDDDDWAPVVAALTGHPVSELQEVARRKIERIERIQRAVQRRSGLDPEENYIRVVEQNQYHCVVDGVPAQVAALVRAEPERFPGIRVMERTRRENPNGDLAPHVVGQVLALSPQKWEALTEADLTWTMNMPVSAIDRRYTMDDLSGFSGIERQYEDLLRGRRGYVVNRWAFRVLKRELVSQQEPPEPGCDVYLTLREDFQRAANAALARAAAEPALDFEQGALVILDVHSGAILAAATWPSYNLATYRDDIARINADPRHPLVFRPLQATLPTGSVYKVITALAALETGGITPQTTFTCAGTQRILGRSWACTGHHGSIALLRAIEKSCNIYFYNAGLRAGGEALTEWGRLLGLGVPSGVDWPFERAGRVPDATATFQVLNLSIGQGELEATPLQVAGAMAVVANGGRRYVPHFFDRAIGPDGEVAARYRPRYTEVPVHPGMLEAVRRGMRMAVETGTARNAGLESFRAAGKTGTAELGPQGLYHAWFAGFAPYEDPKIAFAVVNERTSGHGGTHAAPIMAYALEPVWAEVEAMP